MMVKKIGEIKVEENREGQATEKMDEDYQKDVRACGVNENMVSGKEEWRKEQLRKQLTLPTFNGGEDKEEDEEGMQNQKINNMMIFYFKYHNFKYVKLRHIFV